MRINGDKLKQLRLSRNLSRFDLAFECDVSPSVIDKIENGTKNGMTLCVAYKLASFFNLTIDELIIK